jgi:hypothetical protein
MTALRRWLVLLVMAAAAGACATRPPAAGEWVKIDPAAEDLEQARAACKKEAYEASEDVPRAGYPTNQALAAFSKCMRQRGWAQQAR